jgi:hypothetical protein
MATDYAQIYIYSTALSAPTRPTRQMVSLANKLPHGIRRDLGRS